MEAIIEGLLFVKGNKRLSIKELVELIKKWKETKNIGIAADVLEALSKHVK